MSEDQAHVVRNKLREAENLLLSFELAEPKNSAIHDARILLWKAMDKLAHAVIR